MKSNCSRRIFLGSLTALGLSAIGERSVLAAFPDIDVDAWLQSHPSINASIVWENAVQGFSKPLPFLRWSRQQKDALAQAFQRASQNLPTQVVDPPPNLIQVADENFVDTALKPDDAWQLYLAYVANSLVLEASSRLPWSVTNFSPESLKILFDSREMFTWNPKYHGYEIERSQVGWAVPTSPRKALAFFRTNNIVRPGGSTGAAIAGLLDWCRRKMYHYLGGPGGKNMHEYWQYRGYPPVSRVMDGTRLSSEPAGSSYHWTAGCHGTVGFLRATLRAINVPVKYLLVANHALAYFPTEGKYISHGDDPYDAYSKTHPPKTAPYFPSAKLLIDQAKFDLWFGNSVPEATKFKNIGRRTTELALESLPVHLLRKHCGDVAAHRSHSSSNVYGMFKNFYSLAQLEAVNLWSRMDAEVAKFGGCGQFPAL